MSAKTLLFLLPSALEARAVEEQVLNLEFRTLCLIVKLNHRQGHVLVRLESNFN